MQSFAPILDRRLRDDPGRPFVTFYDDATGERTELSLTTYANWVAKTAGVLVDDLDLTPGDRVRLDLPTHWLGPVFLGAAWTAGLEVVTGTADAVVGGPGAEPDLFCALLPFAVPAREPIPPGALDFGTLWPNQPDAFLGVPGDGSEAALLEATTPISDRVLTDTNPLSDGRELFSALLVGGGSGVWVAHPDPDGWEHRAEVEQANRVVGPTPT